MKPLHDPNVSWITDRWGIQTDTPAATFGFLDVPFDYAVATRPGARYGGREIGAALRSCSTYCADKRVDLASVDFVDLGTVDIVHSLEQSYANISATVAAIPGRVRPVILGGDHSITDPVIRGLRRRSPDIRFGLIVFDAHLDSRPPIPGKEHSGNWVRTIDDVLDHANTVQLGINAPIYSPYYMERAEAEGIMVRTPWEVRRLGWQEIIAEAVAHATRGVSGVYVSVDIDCLDASVAPGTQAPNPNGLLAHEVIDAVFEISRAANVVGFDVTEVSPPLDRDAQTSRVAAEITLNHMAGVVDGLGKCGQGK